MVSEMEMSDEKRTPDTYSLMLYMMLPLVLLSKANLSATKETSTKVNDKTQDLYKHGTTHFKGV